MRDNSLTIFSQIIENDNMIFLSVHTLNTTSFYKFTKNAFTSLFYYTGCPGHLARTFTNLGGTITHPTIMATHLCV